jgi:hypothetical protein
MVAPFSRGHLASLTSLLRQQGFTFSAPVPRSGSSVLAEIERLDPVQPPTRSSHAKLSLSEFEANSEPKTF